MTTAAVEHRDPTGRLHRNDGAPAKAWTTPNGHPCFEWWIDGCLTMRLVLDQELSVYRHDGTAGVPFHAQLTPGHLAAAWDVDSDNAAHSHLWEP